MPLLASDCQPVTRQRTCDEGAVHPPEPHAIVGIEHSDLRNKAGRSREECPRQSERGAPERTAHARMQKRRLWCTLPLPAPRLPISTVTAHGHRTCRTHSRQSGHPNTRPPAPHLPHPHVACPREFDGVVASLGEVRPQQRVPAGGGVQRVGVCVGGQRPSTMCGIEGQRWRCAPPNAQWGIPGCAGQSRG